MHQEVLMCGRCGTAYVVTPLEAKRLALAMRARFCPYCGTPDSSHRVKPEHLSPEFIEKVLAGFQDAKGGDS